jgi:hypothetical protein
MLIDEPLELKKAAAVPLSSMLPKKRKSSRREDDEGKEPAGSIADEEDKERKSIMRNIKDSSSEEQAFKIIRALVPVISGKEKMDNLLLGLEGFMNGKFSRTLIQGK